MSRARVTIHGEDYTIGCAPGEEARITGLARELEAMMTRMSERIGDVGDRTLAVIAGLTALDRLAAAEAANQRLKARVEALERAREEAAFAIDGDDETLVARLEKVASTVDRIAALVNRDTRARTGVAQADAALLRSVAVAGREGEAPAPPSPQQKSAVTTAEPAPSSETPARAGAPPGRLDISPVGAARR